ncbi:Acb2/Tad1 domain-containing protein [Paenibacillus alkalitolerans]|uniref:Acb2/Tad1 domain-containing protein n=1 Tax=Paenibacillus alkalitolerans TaxID=2799335 RepID=UPI001F27DEC2|nr:hypothetical protein [Paenibacillus alkalitolerans]
MENLHLLYSATARCRCGAGLAYDETNIGKNNAWVCSRVLLGEIEPSQDHDEYPFSMYDIKSECQPSAYGATTRPGGVAKTREQGRIAMLGEPRVKMLERNKELFVYHPPKEGQAERYERIRRAAKDFADTVVINGCPSPELTLAIRAIEEAMMRANQSIAVNE